MDGDEQGFLYYGTPIEREEDVTSRKKKAVAEASGQLRTLAPWKQEVTDEEGRRRFHGAFTGGYSAGYYNTVGSKEGWAPSTFTSSRKNRSEVKEQSILNFLDDDEKAEMDGRTLGTSMQFDTFGFTAVEHARKQAEKEQSQNQRPSAIPGPVPDEILAPATQSVGVKLLLKMGWRHGRSIKDSQTNILYDARREARKSFLALASDDVKTQVTDSKPVEEANENISNIQTDSDDPFSKSTPVYVLNPKQDLHGLGYDPYKNAPEFREKKRSRLSGNGKTGHQKPLSKRDSLFGFKSERVAPGFGIGALEELDVEDEDVYASGYDFEETYQIEDIEEPSGPNVANVKLLDNKQHGILANFKATTKTDYQMERFDRPVIPNNFIPRHKFTAPLELSKKMSEIPPPEVPPPEDNTLKVLIEGVASLVARCGKLFEDLSREKNQSNPLFNFLNKGNGHEYYERKLWEDQQKFSDKPKLQLNNNNNNNKGLENAKKMTAEERGKILGEKPLERSSIDLSSADTVNLQLDLTNNFTKPASMSENVKVTKPFIHDPAKQDRFEQFLKEKYQGGLRAKDSGGSSYMSETARARERLEFESAAESMGKGKFGKESKTPNELLADVLANSSLQFTSGAAEKSKDKHEGIVPKSLYPQREEFQWRPVSLLCKRYDLIDPYLGKPPPAPRARNKMESFLFVPDSSKVANEQKKVTELDIEDKKAESIDKEIEVHVEPENVERPVDLYKAIFSDDSDEEGDNITNNPSEMENPEKKIEVANTTLSRLMAGDFLESLGKELGIEVPPDMPYSENKAKDKEKEEVENKSNSIPDKTCYQESKNKVEKVVEEDRKSKDGSKKRRNDERSDSDRDSSSYEYEDRYSSRSKKKKSSSSREKSSSSSRSHSRHHKHKRRDSPHKSRYGSEKDHREVKKDKHKRKDRG